MDVRFAEQQKIARLAALSTNDSKTLKKVIPQLVHASL